MADTASSPISKIYILQEASHEHHTDRKGRAKILGKKSCTSLDEANAAAHKAVRAKKGGPGASLEDEAFTPYLISNPGAVSVVGQDRDGGCYQASKRFISDRVDEWTVQVIEMNVEWPKVPKGKKGRASGASAGTTAATSSAAPLAASAQPNTSQSAGARKRPSTGGAGADERGPGGSYTGKAPRGNDREVPVLIVD